MKKHAPMTFEFYQAFTPVINDLIRSGGIYNIHSKEDIETLISHLNEPDDLSGEEPEFAAEVLLWTEKRKARAQAMLDLLVGDEKYLLCKAYDREDYVGFDQDIPANRFKHKVDAETKMAYLNYLEAIRRTDELLAKQPQ